MTRLFLRFYVVILLAFFATILVVLVWLLRERPEDRAVVERSLKGSLILVRDRLLPLSDDEREREFAVLSESFGYNVWIESPSSNRLSDEARRRLQEPGQPVHEGDEIFMHLTDSEILAMGPLPDFELAPGAGWILVFVVVVWAVVSFLLLRPVINSAGRLEDAATRMAAGDLSARIEPTKLAFDRLARAFNSMAETTDRMVTEQRDLLAAVSHEFRTPLARLRFSTELATRAKDDSERERLLTEMDSDVVELESLVAELLEYLRIGRTKHSAELFDVDRALASIAALNSTDSIDVVVASVPPTELAGERLFVRAVGNLVSNACSYATKTVRIETELDSELALWIRVSDDGPGIAAKDRQRVLLPFVRLDDASDQPGTGLGLAIVAQIADVCSAELTIDTSIEGGTQVSLRWPLPRCHSAG